VALLQSRDLEMLRHRKYVGTVADGTPSYLLVCRFGVVVNFHEHASLRAADVGRQRALIIEHFY